LNHVLKHPDLTLYNDEGNEEDGDGTTKEPSKHYISLFYETLGRIRESEAYSTHRVADDITYMCKTGYWNHPNYFRINGRPTLFVYLSRKLEELGLLQEVLSIMKEAAAATGCGEDVFVVGDHVYGKAPLSSPLGFMDSENVFISSEGGVQEVVDNGGRDVSLGGLDAITNYDVYGSMGSDGLYAGQARVDLYYQRQSKWREWVHQTCPNCGFVPAVSPGYNDLGVRPENQHPPVSRRLTEESPEGSLFQAALKQAVSLVDPNVQNLLLVNSFNEWHEDTQIEPAKAVKATQTGGVEATTLPNSVTHGLEYQGYGELYLNLLREATAINGTSISAYYAK
jgi:glycoprotein endo-alpha-1,2-mannosidase